MPEPNTCLVCARPDVAEIDAALDAGAGLNATARRFDLSRGAIQRHARHRDAKPAKAPEAPPASASPASAPRAPEPPPPPAESPPLSEPAARRTRTGKGGQCACCASPKRGEIDRLLFEGAAYLAIEARVAPGPSHDSIRRHAQRCVRDLIGEASGELRAEVVTTVRDRAEKLMGAAEKLVEEAQDGEAICARCGEEIGAASPKDRAATIGAANQVLTTLGKLTGELTANIEINIVESPRFQRLLAVVVEVCERHGVPAAEIHVALLEAK